MKRFCLAICLILPFVFSNSVLAQEPIIDSTYTLVEKKKINRVLYDFTYKVNIINGDSAVQNVSATVSSTSANTVIIDDRVNFNNLVSGESSESIDTFTLRQNRRHLFNPADLSWDINFKVDEPVPNINVVTSPNEQTFIIGEFQNIATSVNFVPPVEGDTFTIEIEQEVTPNSGLNLSPVVHGATFNPSAEFATTLNQEIGSSLAGEYEIITTAIILETGESATSTVKITVASNEQPSSLVINTPGTENGALASGATSDVVFVVQVQGIELDEILSVNINGINNNNSMLLNDSGQNGDIVANDGSYSSTFSINTDEFLPQQCLTYEAVATTSTESFISLPYDLCVTGFPIGFQPSNTDESNLISDPDTGSLVVADEIIIGFKLETSESTIASIVSSVNGQVIGSLVELGIYQVKLDNPVDSSELGMHIATLMAFTEVEFAEANGVGIESTVVPSDPSFNLQHGLATIRADEAWYIARGHVTVAVVDGGADFTHPDLIGKLIKGKDVVDGGNDPSEAGTGHGTHVAGIISANTNNNVGISGVSWNSKLLIVRASDSTGSTTASKIASGIMYAAGKARIINVSLGVTSGRFLICAAVVHAKSKGSLVVAAAGNNGNSTKLYPAACSGVIAVGNTTSNDARESSSNFGSWVDLAAPGTNILSTVPAGSCNHCDPSGYKALTGTSMASPMVAGAVAVLLSREPSLTNSNIEERLKKTAKKLPTSLNLGAGRIDLFEAVFNGSFEEGNLALWQKNGTVASFEQLGPLMPQDRNRMGYVSTGPADAQTAGSLTQSFTVQEGVSTLPITFTYTFISEEFPEFVGSQFNDTLKISLKAPNGAMTELAVESINSSAYTAISGLDFPGGDSTVGWTGWKTVSKEVPIVAGAGEYQIILEDAGDSIYDTILLIDHIQFK